MTDQLNESGIEAAANQIHMMLAVNIQHAQSIARAAITAYLECAGANAGPYSDAKLLEGRDRFIINKGLWGEFVKQVEGLTAAPTPETREPSVEAPVKDSLTPSNHPEIPESWMLAEINRLREALQGIVDCAMSGSLFEELALDALENRGIDHQSALTAAPTPETREPSEEAITKAMNKNRREYKDPRDARSRMRDALRAAYAIDFPAAPKAPSAEGIEGHRNNPSVIAWKQGYERGRRDENEACAKVAETKGRTKRHVAEAIRARIKRGEGDE